MIKECKVLEWNELVMVVDFDGNKIQMSSTKNKEKVVYVKYENRKYNIVSREEYDQSFIKEEKKAVKKEVSESDE